MNKKEYVLIKESNQYSIYRSKSISFIDGYEYEVKIEVRDDHSNNLEESFEAQLYYEDILSELAIFELAGIQLEGDKKYIVYIVDVIEDFYEDYDDTYFASMSYQTLESLGLDSDSSMEFEW